MVRGGAALRAVGKRRQSRRTPKSTAPAASGGDTPTVFVTEAGAIIGTVSYMAPEQLLGEPLGGACDVFSFGCVLYEALSGRAPFAAKTQAETIARILHDEPAPLPADADPRLSALVQRMLAKQPAARPSMRAVTQERRAIARGSGTRATTVPVRKPRRWGAAVATMLVVAAIVTAAALKWRPRSAPPDRPRLGVTDHIRDQHHFSPSLPSSTLAHSFPSRSS